MAKVRLDKDPRRMVVARTTGERVPLKCFEGNYWIIPRKLGIEAFQLILETSGLRVDQSKIQEKVKEKAGDKKLTKQQAEDQRKEAIRALVVEEVEKASRAGEKVLRNNLTEAMKVAFLHGVYDHNMYEHVLLKNPDGSFKMEGDEYLCEEDINGEPKMRKIPWDEKLCDDFKGDTDIAMEVFRIVMDFNSGIKKKTSKK